MEIGSPVYREFKPRQELRDHVECFWTITRANLPSVPEQAHRVLPDGCMDIIFDFGDSQRQSAAYIVGAMSRPILSTISGQVDLLGVRFKPGASQSFFRIFASECMNKTVPLDQFWSRTGNEIWERLIHLREHTARIVQLEFSLLKIRNCEQALDPAVSYCVQQIQTCKGNTKLFDLEDGTGFSARQLERKFAKDIGLTPKTFARVIRFQSIIKLTNGIPNPNWAAISVEHGYSDQPHLIRDFKAFSGLTPVEFLTP